MTCLECGASLTGRQTKFCSLAHAEQNRNVRRRGLENYLRSQQYRERHLNEVRERDRLRAAAEKDQRAEYFREWRAANRDHLREYGRRYAIENKDVIQERFQRWYADNAEQAQANARRRKATKAGLPSEPYLSSEILDRDQWVCQLCQKGIPRGAQWPNLLSASIDHIIPISRGGHDTPANVQAAHLGCNVAKGDRVPKAS